MKLITLGTSHGDPVMTRFNSSSVLRTAQGDYIFEAGAPVNALLIRKKIEFSNIRAVFVSHSHEDHTGGLPGLVKSLVKRPVPGQHTRLMLPEQGVADALKAFVDSTHRPWTDELISAAVVSQGLVYDDGNLKVTAFLTDHLSLGLEPGPSWAFLAEAEGKRIVFTGDLSSDLHDFPREAFSEPAFCVMECQHYDVKLAGAILKQLPLMGFIGVHISNYWNGNARKFYRTLGSPRIPFAFAEDGMEFDLGHLTSDDFTAAVLTAPNAPAETAALIGKAGAGLTVAALESGALRQLRKAMKSSGVPLISMAAGKAQVYSHAVLLLDSSMERLCGASRTLLAKLLAENKLRDLLCITHCHPGMLPVEDRWLLAAAVNAGVIGSAAVLNLPSHGKCRSIKGLRCELITGNTAEEGRGAVTFFTRSSDGSWHRKTRSL